MELLRFITMASVLVMVYFMDAVALDQSGSKTYSRDAEKHGGQEATDRKTGRKEVKWRRWTELSTGTNSDEAGNGHNVMFRQGLGEK